MRGNFIIRKYPLLFDNMKWILLIIVVLTALLIYNLRWGYGKFDVLNPGEKSTFVYKRKWANGNYHSLKLKVKGELIGGIAIIKVYQCREDPNRTNEILELKINGKIDTLISNQYYSGEACILYKPHGVKGGKLDISIAVN